MKNLPVPMTQDQFVDVLEDILSKVKAGDSFEGSLEYTMPETCRGYDEVRVDTEDVKGSYCKACGVMGDQALHDSIVDPPGTAYKVRAMYRVGNLMGQGGMRQVGRFG